MWLASGQWERKKIPWTGIEPGSAILSQKQKQLFCFCKVSQGVLYIMLKRKKIFPCLSVCSGGCRASLETFHLSGVVSASLNAAGIEKGLKFISQGSVYISHSGVVHLLHWSFLSFISRPFGGVDQWLPWILSWNENTNCCSQQIAHCPSPHMR